MGFLIASIATLSLAAPPLKQMEKDVYGTWKVVGFNSERVETSKEELAKWDRSITISKDGSWTDKMTNKSGNTVTTKYKVEKKTKGEITYFLVADEMPANEIEKEHYFVYEFSEDSLTIYKVKPDSMKKADSDLIIKMCRVEDKK
jgi:hypothetical protein